MATMRAVGILFVLALLTGAPAGAAPRAHLKPEARVHLERGLKLYDRQRYDDAILELRAGLAIDPQPDLLYALGQAERRRGNCKRAVEYYQSCLALVKDPASVAALRVQIERCRVEQDEDPRIARPSEPTAPPAATPTTTATSPTPREPAPASAPADTTPKESAALPESDDDDSAAPPVAAMVRARPHPWYRDSVGWTLTAGGLAAIAAGGALVGVARARLDTANDSYQNYADARTAPALWTGGIVALSVGGAVLAGGIIRLAVVAARRSHTESR
jgi:tetratricopeptide (TPR) repeat protein